MPPQNPDDPLNLGLRPIGSNEDDPLNLGLRSLDTSPPEPKKEPSFWENVWSGVKAAPVHPMLPSVSTEQAFEWGNKSFLPDKKESDVPKFKQTLKDWGAPESVANAASYIPRAGEWAYSRIAQPIASPFGIATLPLAEARAGRIALAGLGTYLGGKGLYESVPKAIENPSFENVADVGLSGFMAASVPLGARAGAFTERPKPIPPEQSRLPGMENIDFNQQAPLPAPPRVPTPEERLATTEKRALSEIDTKAKADIFALKVEQSEAARAGDHARATAIENQILQRQMQASEDTRNWQPSPEPTFTDVGGEQPDLPFGQYREKGKFISTPSPEMRRGVPRPSPFTFPEQPVIQEPLFAPFNESTSAPVSETPIQGADARPEVIVLKGSLKDNPGYTTVRGGLVNAQHQPLLVRADVVDKYTNPTTRPDVSDVTATRPAVPVGKTRTPVDTIELPNEQADTVAANLKGAGYEVERGPTKSIFRKFITDEQGAGEFDNDLWVRLARSVTEKFKERFGREPNEAELRQGVEESRQESGPKIGEQAGRVAEFDPNLMSDHGFVQSLKSKSIDELRELFTRLMILTHGEGGGTLTSKAQNRVNAVENELDSRSQPGESVSPEVRQRLLDRLKAQQDQRGQWPPSSDIFRPPVVQPRGITDVPGLPEQGPLGLRGPVPEVPPTPPVRPDAIQPELYPTMDPRMAAHVGTNRMGRPELRKQLRNLRNTRTSERLTRADELLERARRAEETGDSNSAQIYREKANRDYAETAGQLKFGFLKARVAQEGPKLTPEQVDRALASVNESMAGGLDHSFARHTLAGLEQDGPPGLTVENPYGRSYRITYRSPSGKPIGFASVHMDSSGRRGEVGIYAADRDAGMLYGRAAIAIRKKLIELNAIEPSGSYSKHTWNAIQTFRDFTKDEGGWQDPSRLIEAFGQGYDKVKSLIKSSGVNDIVKRLWNEEEGSVKIPTWQDVKDTTQKVKEFTGVGQGLVPKGPRRAKGTPPGPREYAKEILVNLPSNTTAMLDLSPTLRQALTSISTPEFWKGLPRMVGALHAGTFDKIDADLRANKIMQQPTLPNGQLGKSFGEQIGTKMFSPASKPGQHAELMASKWLEGGEGKNPISWAWKNSMGFPIRATNRSFITLLNYINVTRTEKLLDLERNIAMQGLTTGRARMPGVLGGIDLPQFMGGGNIGFKRSYTPKEALDLNPYTNIVRAKEIAEFVNATTGHATPTNSIERAVQRIGPVLFAPGLLNSRIRMLNPHTYIMASPFVRRQYLRAALSTAAAWYVSTELIKNAAGPSAEVNDDPTSADFGKVRVGNARLDLGGGFLQFATAAGRLWQGGATSSSTGRFHQFGEGYQAQTEENMMERFFVNKLNPTAKFAYDIANATQYNPVHMGDRALQMFVPMVSSDLHEIYNEDPNLLPLFGPAAILGGGTQIYGKGESTAKILDPENDWIYHGGMGLHRLMPWNWNEQGQ